MRTPRNRYVIVVGDPVSGFRFVGPFKDEFAAEEYSKGRPFIQALDSWIAVLHTPKPKTERSKP